MDESEEKALVRGLVRMDDEAWTSLCTTYGPPLAALVRLRFRCAASVVEEIVQLAFVRCVRSIGTFDPARGRLLPWLKTVAANEARRWLRKNARRADTTSLSALSADLATELAAALDHGPLPDELLARQELRLIVQECLLQLNTRHRRVLQAKYIDGLKVSRIADDEGTTDKAVESALARARESFRVGLLARLGRSE